MKILKYIGLTLFSLIIIIASYVYYLSVQRDTKIWNENIQVASNINVSIEQMRSQKKYYGGHAFGWGGGDYKNHIKFMHSGIKYIHKTSYIPIVIRLFKGNFYLIYYDRETHLRETTFRFYKSTSTGVFKEIKAAEFPKHLAIQNRWFSDNGDEKNLEGLNPQKMVATMTVDIWYMIEGKQSLFTSNVLVPIEFIEKYKEKYITNGKY